MEDVILQILEHITVLNDEFGEIAVKVAILETQVRAVLWLVGITMLGVLTPLIARIMKSILKNGKYEDNQNKN